MKFFVAVALLSYVIASFAYGGDAAIAGTAVESASNEEAAASGAPAGGDQAAQLAALLPLLQTALQIAQAGGSVSDISGDLPVSIPGVPGIGGGASSGGGGMLGPIPNLPF